ncbi:16S rRNA (uracil(1498)-N(3))-methyltransferase [Candidatus Microgenomates bacterium]|nr:MAG: 16S rRNA (uracil(1498)-N(3))-methyltransferase [Candidatus Microgenomates bacterium]
MTLHRFYIPSLNIVNGKVILPPETSRQIRQVLRLKTGDKVVVFSDTSEQYLIQIEAIENVVAGTVISQNINNSEPRTFIILYQALTPREKFESILQKGTEIGISSFVPIETKRSLIRKKDVKEEKIKRWEKIIQEAAEQSERGKVPKIFSPMNFGEAVEIAVKDGVVLIAWEEENEQFLSEEILRSTLVKQVDSFTSFGPSAKGDTERVSIFIGPEGGFEKEEIETAKKLGAKTISLGPRILRTETAGPFMASLILFAKGDLETKRIDIK